MYIFVIYKNIIYKNKIKNKKKKKIFFYTSQLYFYKIILILKDFFFIAAIIANFNLYLFILIQNT